MIKITVETPHENETDVVAETIFHFLKYHSVYAGKFVYRTREEYEAQPADANILIVEKTIPTPNPDFKKADDQSLKDYVLTIAGQADKDLRQVALKLATEYYRDSGVDEVFKVAGRMYQFLKGNSNGKESEKG